MLTLGIDPGLHGALAWAKDGRILAVEDVPVLVEGRQKAIDAAWLAALLRGNKPDQAVIEQVGARPTDAKASAFAFGRITGALEALVMAEGIPLHRVAPVTWRRWAGLAPGAEKNASITAALRLCPSARPFLTRHDRADAVLMALWGGNRA
jgi:Holliday junction resolvasome RuvABC endonuclease subunit